MRIDASDFKGGRRNSRWPGALSNFEVTLMANNVRVSYELPQVGSRQAPLAHVVLEARVSAALDWAVIAVNPVPSTEIILQDMAPGDWSFRAFAVDTKGLQSKNHSTASLSIPFDGPGDLSNFAVSLVA